MMIPAIDLQRGRVVQLVQGRATALERDLEPTLEWLRGSGVVQAIDLDAARGLGDNRALVDRCLRARFRLRVGGGIRTLERAAEILGAGAERVILGSAAFLDGAPNLAFLDRLAGQLGRERIILAVDGRGGRVAVEGWNRMLPLAVTDALPALTPFCGEFLYTHIDGEGLMRGFPLALVPTLQAATGNRITVAGGIATQSEIDALHALGCDAVVGMALYTGRLLSSNASGRRDSGGRGDL